MGACFRMKRARQLRRLLVMAVCALLLSGWSGSWETLQRESEKLTSVRARFTQLKNMRILAKPLVSTGTFYFKAPDSVRWEYEAPVKSILLMHEGSVRRYTQGAQGLTGDAGAGLQSMHVMLEEIALWSKGRFTESPGFAAVLKEGDRPIILLTPRDEGLAKVISGIEIALAPDRPGVISNITIREGEGGTTALEFHDVHINGALNESVFRSP
jgi:hypothetical protein